MKGAHGGSTPVRTWSTDVLPVPEQFVFWRDVCWQAFVPVSLTRYGDGPFAGSVSMRRVGALTVSLISSQAQSVTRSEADIARQAGDVFFLNLPLTAGTSATQQGRTAQLAADDFTLVDSTRPFGLQFTQPFQQISVTLPHDLLAPQLANPLEATAVRVPGQVGVGAVASAALRSLATVNEPFDRHAARSVGEYLAGLIALAVGGVSTPPASASRAVLLQAALDAVERSLGDPDLSPSSVAQSIGISTRYLHRLFADRGLSFCRWLSTRRLERCYRDLTDPTRSHWTIAQIACHHGLTDPAYFARTFKRHYNATPREVRREAIAGLRP